MGCPYNVAVVVNPRSANGRTGRRWPLLEPRVKAVVGVCAVLISERPGHAEALARAALRDGYDRIVSVGGDGTHHEVLNGFFERDAPVNPEASMAILPQGTGSDSARTLGIPKGLGAIPLLAGDRTVASDVGRVRYRRPGGGDAQGYFLNVAHLGMGGAVAYRVNRTTKAFGGFLSFLWGVTATLVTYKNTPMMLEIDGVQVNQRCNDVIVANGRYDGGGMLVAPQARLDSGAFEVFVIGDVGRAEAIRNLPRLYRGTLLDRPDLVQRYQARHIAARSETTVLLNLEGEQAGQLPVTIDLAPGAIRLVRGTCCR